MKGVVITADDFGLSPSVNRAVQRAHEEGILSAASLMVGGEAAGEAVALARGMPSLRIGLHLTLVDARPLLPPEEIPHLVDGAGRLRRDLWRAGFSFFFHPGARCELRAEIRAQFQAFRETGLPLDHVNAHHHLHLHPTVLGLVLEMAREFGAFPVRLPREQVRVSWRSGADRLLLRLFSRIFLSPWTILMRLRLKENKIPCNDRIFGLVDTGRMDASLHRGFLEKLPEGITEIFLHPDEEGQGTRELKALTAPSVGDALAASGAKLGGFSDFLKVQAPRGKTREPSAIIQT